MAVVVLVVAVVVTVATLVAVHPQPVAAATHSATPKATPTPEPFTANGTVTVPADVAGMLDASPDRTITLGAACTPSPGFDDFTQGAQVLVSDPDGEKVAVGVLGSPTVVQRATDMVKDARCQFTFAIPDVPGGRNLYSVHIGNTFRGEQTFSQGELYIGVSLSIG